MHLYGEGIGVIDRSDGLLGGDVASQSGDEVRLVLLDETSQARAHGVVAEDEVEVVGREETGGERLEVIDRVGGLRRLEVVKFGIVRACGRRGRGDGLGSVVADVAATAVEDARWARGPFARYYLHISGPQLARLLRAGEVCRRKATATVGAMFREEVFGIDHCEGPCRGCVDERSVLWSATRSNHGRWVEASMISNVHALNLCRRGKQVA